MAEQKYVDLLTGEERSFTPSDEALVLLDPGASPPAAGDLAEALEPLHLPADSAQAGGPFIHLQLAEAEKLRSRKVARAAAVLGRDERGRQRAFVEGEILVELEEGLGRPAREVIDEVGSRIVRDHYDPRVFTIATRLRESPIAAIERLRTTGVFAWLAPSEIPIFSGSADATSAQKRQALVQGLGLPREVQLGGAAGDEPLLLAIPSGDQTPEHDVLSLPLHCMGIDEAWRRVWVPEGSRIPGAGTAVALVDEPTFREHPDLAALDFDHPAARSPDRSSLIFAQENHGTRMAGVATALRNGSGALGVAPGTGLVPVGVDLLFGGVQRRFGGEVGRVGDRTDVLAAAFDWLAARPELGLAQRVVVNFSWSVGSRLPILERRLETALERGYLMVAAADNQSSDLDLQRRYPACLDDVVCVAARQLQVRVQNGRPELVCGDLHPRSNHGSCVDLTAPGELYFTTDRSNGYTEVDKTSPAAAAVSAVAALLWSRFPQATSGQVLDAMRASAAERPAPGGPGWVHAADALEHLERALVPAPRIRPPQGDHPLPGAGEPDRPAAP